MKVASRELAEQYLQVHTMLSSSTDALATNSKVYKNYTLGELVIEARQDLIAYASSSENERYDFDLLELRNKIGVIL